MTHSLAILALKRTGIDWITPEPSSSLYRSFSMLNLSCVNPNSPSSLTLTAYILRLQQTRTAESEVLHPILPNWPLTLLQHPKTTEYHQNGVSIQLVYCIWRFIFIHYQQQTQSKPIYLQLLPLTMVPTPSSVQVLQDSSTHRQICAKWSLLIWSN